MPSNRSINQLDPTMTAPWTEPAPLPDITGGETNLLPRSAWSDPANPLRVEFKPWYDHPVGIGKTESVSVFLDDDESNEIGYREWTLPMSPDEHYVEISAEKLPQGEHQLSFIMTNYIGAEAKSYPFTVTVDKQAPQLNASSQLIFPGIVSPPNAITAAYLADPDNQDQVLARVPDYLEKKVGDVITWYWEKSPGGREVAGSKTLEPGDINQPVQVNFTGDLLRKANGAFYATYRVRDRAGNGDDVLSKDQQLDVNIRAPAQRKFPTVKQAANAQNGTGVLDPFRGSAGVTVLVAATEIDPFEEVTVDFIGLGGEGGIGSVMGVKPVIPGGLEFAIAPPVVAANIPVRGDGRKIEIRYWAGHDVQHSAVYTLTLNELSGESFGSVHCPEAETGSPATLSKSDVARKGFSIAIEKWAYHESTQRINVWAVAPSGQTDFLEGAPTPLDAQAKFTESLPKDYVASLPLNSTFTLHASVSFDQGHSYRDFSSKAMKVIA